MASATHLLARSDHSHLHGNGDLNDDDDGNDAESSSDSLCESEFIPYREDGEIEKGGEGGGGGEEEEDEEEEGEEEEEEEEDSEGEEFGHGFSISSSLSRCSSSNSIVIGSTSSDQSFGRGRTDQIDLDTDTLESCHWTDDKHRSYLTFMEENFVKEMFDGEYSKSHTQMGTTAQSQQHKFNQFETRRTWRSILMEHCNIPPNMPWNFSQTPRVNHLRHIPTTHFQESAETKDADTHPSTRSLEGNKELEYMLMAPNDEAQERRICCNQSASSSMIDDASNSELEDLSEDPNFNTLEDQVILPRTQCSTSFVKPRKRSVVLVPDEWKISTRRKLHE